MNDINEPQKSLIDESIITFADQSLISKIDESPQKSLIEENKAITIMDGDDYLDAPPKNTYEKLDSIIKMSNG
jgi:hypothetical protein